MNVQYIKGMDGKELAVLPVEEFVSMRPLNEEDFEDFMDARIIDEAIANRDAGEEYIPGEVVERIFLGEEHPIRVYREWRGYTLKTLSEKIGITAGYLSNIENSTRDGTVNVYYAIAKALNVSIDMLIPNNAE